MFLRSSHAVSMVLVTGVLLPRTASAGPICPDSSYVVVDYACRFVGSFRTGEPKDWVTVSSSGGETLAENGISIRAYLRDCDGRPVVGVPADSVVLTSTWLCLCPGGNIADGPSDEFGCSRFSGMLRVGGCASNLVVKAQGAVIDTIPVNTNSPRIFGCGPDQGDLSYMAAHISAPGNYSICLDFNEDGIIDAVDFAEFVSRYYHGQRCSSSADFGDRSARRRTEPRNSGDGHVPRAGVGKEPPVKIGLFFDREGTVCGGEIHQGQAVDLWVVARVQDIQGPPIAGAEFLLVGFPREWFVDVYAEQGVALDLSTPLEIRHRLLGLDDPQPVDQGYVTLARVWCYAFSEIPSTVIRIEGSSNPTNPAFTGPVVIVWPDSLDCGQSSLRPVPAEGLEAVINGRCSTGVVGTTWQRVKLLYRD